jgi:hypothetical protein
MSADIFEKAKSVDRADDLIFNQALQVGGRGL